MLCVYTDESTQVPPLPLAGAGFCRASWNGLRFKTWSEAERYRDDFYANGKGHPVRTMITGFTSGGYDVRIWWL